MADVFLSYAREDIECAKLLVSELERHGFSVFWDRRLLPGVNYRLEIAAQIDAARCVIVLWSHTSVASKWVADEADRGLEADKLVQVRIDEVEQPLGFGQGQAADLIGWDGDASTSQLESLSMGVRNLVRSLPAVEPPGEPADDSVDVPGDEARVSDEVEPPTPPVPSGWFERVPVLGPTLLLGVVFLVNAVQTAIDPDLTPAALGAEGGYPIADAFHWFENGLSFEFHDVAGPVTYVGYSVAYFFLFPLLALGVAVSLARRPDPFAFRAFCLAVAINYIVCLPFFVAFPVPERWAFPDTGAMLLSDKWSDSLIEAIRPISGLDNCFPSFHTSLSVLVATACWLFGVRLRACITAFCASVVLATFALGIHWLPDVIAGAAIGAASMLVAVRWMRLRAHRLA